MNRGRYPPSQNSSRAWRPRHDIDNPSHFCAEHFRPGLGAGRPYTDVYVQPCGPADPGDPAGADQGRVRPFGRPGRLADGPVLRRLLCDARHTRGDVGGPGQPAQHHLHRARRVVRDDGPLRPCPELLAPAARAHGRRRWRSWRDTACHLDDRRPLSAAGARDGARHLYQRYRPRHHGGLRARWVYLPALWLARRLLRSRCARVDPCPDRPFRDQGASARPRGPARG